MVCEAPEIYMYLRDMRKGKFSEIRESLIREIDSNSVNVWGLNSFLA
jgi:hypothetical protein